MKPQYDLNSLVRKERLRRRNGIPGDTAKITESVACSLNQSEGFELPEPTRPGAGVPADATQVSEKIIVSLQAKKKDKGGEL